MSRKPPQRGPPTELEPLIGRFVHQANRPRASEALLTLQKVASMVKPIMRARNWYVGQLTEFCEAGLLGLNINGGQEIRLRLRYPSDPSQFVPFDEVVDTMLHELSHIVHGPHDQKFYALWDQLRDEHAALKRKGYSGEGFLGKGKRVGGSGRIPMQEARRRARAAAEKRRTLTAGSGQRLGGSAPLPRNGDEARATIIAAIERRKKIEQGCGVGRSNSVQIEESTRPDIQNAITTHAPKMDVDEDTMMKAFIDLIQEEERELYGEGYVPPSQDNPSGMRAVGFDAPPSPNTLRQEQMNIEAELERSKVPASIKHTPKPVAPNRPNSKAMPLSTANATTKLALPNPTTPPSPTTWTCEICTLVNPIDLPSCDACESPRPEGLLPKKEIPNALQPRLKSSEAYSRIKAQEDAKNQLKAAAWECHTCHNFNEQMWWSCTNCGSVKTSS